jgi:hypothetical protein
VPYPWSWQNIALSADGSTIIAAAWYSSGEIPGPIYTSTDFGATWVSNTIPQSLWQGLLCSADGSKLMAVSAGTNFQTLGQGNIWAGQLAHLPQLSIGLANTNLTLSWLVPSTNFVLQSCADLTVPNWSDVTNVPVLNLTNLQYQATLPAAASNAFFRLSTP